VPAENPTELSEKVNKLLGDRDLRIKMGKFGRRTIIQRGLTWETHAKRTIKIYSKLLMSN
jgi:glycosyltransferase involved in cell wall biosynthesis